MLAAVGPSLPGTGLRRIKCHAPYGHLEAKNGSPLLLQLVALGVAPMSHGKRVAAALGDFLHGVQQEGFGGLRRRGVPPSVDVFRVAVLAVMLERDPSPQKSTRRPPAVALRNSRLIAEFGEDLTGNVVEPAGRCWWAIRNHALLSHKIGPCANSCRTAVRFRLTPQEAI